MTDIPKANLLKIAEQRLSNKDTVIASLRQDQLGLVLALKKIIEVTRQDNGDAAVFIATEALARLPQ